MSNSLICKTSLQGNNMKVWNTVCSYKSGGIVSRPIWLIQSILK